MGRRNAVSLTKTLIQGLGPQEVTYRVNDTTRGLCIQITPAGVKSWVLRYETGKGTRSVTLGRWPDLNVEQARKKATDTRSKLQNGEEVQLKRKAKSASAEGGNRSKTFGDLAEDFYREHVQVRNQPSYQRYQRWAIDKYVVPVLGEKAPKDVTVSAITGLLDGLASTPVTANRVKSLLSKMFNWARRRYPELEAVANPVTGHERNEEVARDVRLTEEEVREIGERYRASVDPLRHAIIFLLLTGARAGVVLFEREENRFPEERMLRFDAKAPGLKKCRAVYMCSAAVQLLPQIPYEIDRNALWRAWIRLRGDIACSIHDLRRTFGSIGVDLGHDEAVVDALLGHSRGKIRDTYIRRADPTLLAVADDIGGHIAGLLGLKAARRRTGRASKAS